jgi:hypothetical protein
MDQVVSENSTGLFAVGGRRRNFGPSSSRGGASPVVVDILGQPELDFRPHGSVEITIATSPSIVRAFGGRKGTRLLRPLLTSAVRSDHLSMASVAEATHGRSPGVSSIAFRAQSPDVRFAPLMDMDFAVRRPLVRCWRLISGSCPSTRTFAPRFFQTPPRGGLRPCASLVLHLHQVAQRTYTSKLLNMPGTRRNRCAVVVVDRLFTLQLRSRIS